MKHLLSTLAIFLALCNGYTQDPQNHDRFILTPPPPVSPRISGPEIYGVRPGSPFIFRIPCTGERPVEFGAELLPEGLQLDPATGIISGIASAPGTYKVRLTAGNARGEFSRDLTIVVGDQLALTPPMGWNSWYIHYDRISDETMREAADQMIATGMADFGYQYVNIDDCWMRKLESDNPGLGGQRRDSDGVIIPNERFPDMMAMTGYIHSKGLKAGIYISPGPSTCAGYEGSYGHEALDARTFAGWGFDFLKYDWCSYGQKASGKSREEYMKPYRVMWDLLHRLDRDILLNLCQYGMGDVWTWGGEVGHCWRTTGDLGLEEGGELPGFYHIGFSNAQHWEYAKPGSWNDPDYILIGWVGDARNMAVGKLTTLTPHEQYSYMSMWCLMAAPLVFSGDMARLDAFTLNVLCNHEVIAVDQDLLGKQARIVRHTEEDFVLLKEMEDGSKAMGVFNLKNEKATVKVSFDEIGLTGKQLFRDLWRQKELGTVEKTFQAEIPAHGVSMVRIRDQH